MGFYLLIMNYVEEGFGVVTEDKMIRISLKLRYWLNKVRATNLLGEY